MAIARSRGLKYYPTDMPQQLAYKLNFQGREEYYAAVNEDPKGIAALIRSKIGENQ